MTKRKTRESFYEFPPIQLKAYRQRWGNDYKPEFDDTGWWKWFDGYEKGRRDGLRVARKRTAVGKEGGR